MNITESFYKGSIDADDNYYFYPNNPKMSDCEIIALSLVGETIGIDSENYLFGKIKSGHIHDSTNLIDRSRFNRRRRRLGELITRLNDRISSLLNEGENIFLVDSIPVPICRNARINRSKICKNDNETAPDRDYSAVTKSYIYGYKLHLAISIRGVYSSMGLTKSSIHDIHLLNEVKHSGIADCALIGDKGYVSEPIQQDLFTTRQIKLFTPVKSGQHDKERISFSSQNITTNFKRKGRAGKHEDHRQIMAMELRKERATRMEGSFGTEKQQSAWTRSKPEQN